MDASTVASIARGKKLFTAAKAVAVARASTSPTLRRRVQCTAICGGSLRLARRLFSTMMDRVRSGLSKRSGRSSHQIFRQSARRSTRFGFTRQAASSSSITTMEARRSGLKFYRVAVAAMARKVPSALKDLKAQRDRLVLQVQMAELVRKDRRVTLVQQVLRAPSGAAGADGEDGADGVEGPQGPAGPQGEVGPARVTTSDTPPLDPVDGDQWFDTRVCTTFVYYDDGTSAQWVPSVATTKGDDGEQGAQGVAGPVGPAGPAGADGSDGVAGAVIAGAPPLDPSVGQLWFDNRVAQLFIFYDDGSSLQWVPAVATVQGPAGLDGGRASTSITPPLDPLDGDLWWDRTLGQLFICFDDGSSKQWVQACVSAGAARNEIKMLTDTLQAALARIDALESRLSALETA